MPDNHFSRYTPDSTCANRSATGVVPEAKNVLLIPVSAIGNATPNSAILVRVLKPNNEVEPRAIKIGVKSEIMAEVTQGLREKEKIILNEIKSKGRTGKSALTARKGP